MTAFQSQDISVQEIQSAQEYSFAEAIRNHDG
jgi:hypothetical protein